MPFIKHALGRTYFEQRGSGKKTPIVFLHGGPGGNMEYGRPLFRLAKGRKVFLYDQLGCGRSGVTRKNHWSIKTFVREFDLLVKAWGLKEFHLVGTSWGGTLALEIFLHRHVRGIQSITFQSPLISSSDWKKDCEVLIRKLPPKARKVIETCHEIGATDSKVYEHAGKEFMKRHCLRNQKMAKILERKRKKLRWNNSGKDIYLNMWGPSEFHATGSLKNYNKVSQLRKVKVPVLFIAGEHDESRPETLKKYARRIKSAELKVLKNCSHAILYEKPELMLKALNSFLEKL